MLKKLRWWWWCAWHDACPKHHVLHTYGVGCEFCFAERVRRHKARMAEMKRVLKEHALAQPDAAARGGDHG